MKGLILTTDLMFSSRVLAAAGTLGKSLEIVMSPAGLAEASGQADVSLVLIDLTTPGLDLASVVPPLLAQAPHAHVVAFGPHVDDQLLAAAIAAGCHSVLTRGQFFQSYTQLLNSRL